MKTKEMKNNKTMRMGLILAVIAIITLIALIVTFAKYASQGTGEDSARIAKWGLNVNENLDLKLFSSEYKDPKGQTITVDASDDASVIAPGTSQEAQVKLGTYSGQAPEVMYHFEPSLTITNLGDSGQELIKKLDENNGFKWTLKVNDGTTVTYNTSDEICQAVSGLGQKDIAPNTYPTNFGPTTEPTVTIGWVWDFNNGGDPSDTELGNLVAANDLTSLKVVLGIKAYQCQGCSTDVALAGKVTQSDRTGVAGANVAYNYSSAANDTKSTTTKADGTYSMQVPTNTKGTLTITKDDYKEITTEEFSVADQPVEKNITNFDPAGPFTVKFVCSPTEGGSVSPTQFSEVPAGSEITDSGGGELIIKNSEAGWKESVKATANSGYTFSGWDGIPETGKVKTNLTLTANFTKETTYTVTFESSPKDVGIVLDEEENQVKEVSGLEKSSEIYVDAESKKLVIVDPDTRAAREYHTNDATGYIFKEWQGIPESGTIEDNITVTAAFIKNSYLTVDFASNPTDGGYVVDEEGTTIESEFILYGTKPILKDNVLILDEYTLTPIAKSGYTFSSWSNIPEIITEDVTINANFKEEQKENPMTFTVTTSSTTSAVSESDSYISFPGEASGCTENLEYGVTELVSSNDGTIEQLDNDNEHFYVDTIDDKLCLVCKGGTSANKYNLKVWAKSGGGDYKEKVIPAESSTEANFTWTVSEPKDVKQVTYVDCSCADSYGEVLSQQINFVPAYNDADDASKTYLQDNHVKYYTDANGTQEDEEINTLIYQDGGCTMSELAKVLVSNGIVKQLWVEADEAVTFYACAGDKWNDFFTVENNTVKYNKSGALYASLLENRDDINSVYFDNKDDQTILGEDNWDAHDRGTTYEKSKCPTLNGVYYGSNTGSFRSAYGTSILGNVSNIAMSTHAGGPPTAAYMWKVNGSQYWYFYTTSSFEFSEGPCAVLTLTF